MNDRQLETVKQVGEFLAGTEIVEFDGAIPFCLIATIILKIQTWLAWIV